MTHVGISNKGRGRMGYSINGRNVYEKWYLVYGSVERDRSALTKQQCAQKKGNSEGNTARGLLAGTTFSGQYNFCDLEIFPFNSGLMGKKKYWAMTESDIQ